MDCTREGKECNEYMCGNSVDGICNGNSLDGYHVNKNESWQLGYQQGKSDKYQEIISDYMLLTEKQVAEIRADAIEELLPFWNELEDMMLEWICDDLLGEFINPETDESWCSEHCGKCKKYECIKKWCELKEHKNGESNRD